MLQIIGKKLGCVQLNILEQQYKRTELKVSYRNKELTLKNTVLNERSNTLIMLIDPTGKGPTGDYYNTVGKYLGNDGKDDNKVYTIDEKDIKYKNVMGTTNEGKEVVLARKIDYENSNAQYLGQVKDVFTTGDNPTDQKIQSLHPAIRMMAKNFMIEANQSSGDTKIRMAQGYRTFGEQDALYAKGRTAPGGVVTNARGGYSNHNFGLAFDIVGITNGKVDYNLDWTKLSEIGKSNGFDWGGDWKSFQDKPHFENLFGHSLKELRTRYNSGSKTNGYINLGLGGL